MTYRWSHKQIEEAIKLLEDLPYSCEVFKDLDSILAAMELTDQKYVYIKGQPEY